LYPSNVCVIGGDKTNKHNLWIIRENLLSSIHSLILIHHYRYELNGLVISYVLSKIIDSTIMFPTVVRVLNNLQYFSEICNKHTPLSSIDIFMTSLSCYYTINNNMIHVNNLFLPNQRGFISLLWDTRKYKVKMIKRQDQINVWFMVFNATFNNISAISWRWPDEDNAKI
jgi:hypothetical protein